MPREATLFEDSKGSVVRAYILMEGNIPPAWIDRARKARKNRHKAVANAIKSGNIKGLAILEEWETAYQKECFYYGIRCLMELERNGKTKL